MKPWQVGLLRILVGLVLVALGLLATYHATIWAIGQFVKAGFPGS